MKHARADYDRIQDPAGKIGQDEPVFLLRAQDKSAPPTLRFWAEENHRNRGDLHLSNLAEEWAGKMEEWQRKNGMKPADLATTCENPMGGAPTDGTATAGQPAQPTTDDMTEARVEAAETRLDNALWLLMEQPIHRYLMSCAHGRWDGAEKAQRHMELCQIFLAVEHGCLTLEEVRREHEQDYAEVHDHTQKLTDHMDEVIGFPTEEDPNYDFLAPMFFDWFVKYARAAVAHGAKMARTTEGAENA